MVQHSHTAFAQFISQLWTHGTFDAILDALQHGTNFWLSPHPRVHSLTRGQIGATAILTTAFHEQFHSIVGFQFFLGRVSLKWGVVYLLYTNHTNDTMTALRWTSLLICLFLKFLRSAWAHGEITYSMALWQKNLPSFKSKLFIYRLQTAILHAPTTRPFCYLVTTIYSPVDPWSSG